MNDEGAMERMIALMQRKGVPVRWQDGLARYLVAGVPPGHFLTAVLSGDLYGAASRADETAWADVPALARFLCCNAPADAFGSPEKIRAWTTRPRR